MKACVKQAGMIAAALTLLLGASAAFAAPEKSSPAPKKTPSIKTEKDEAPGLSGKVVETMNAGGYTYVCLEKKGKKSWVAVPETKVTVGKEMTFLPGAVMENFTSKSLGRTFDTIVFSGGAATPGAVPQDKAHSAALQAGSGSKAAASPKDKAVKVDKASGTGAYTVSEVYEKRASLNKKTVVVKGKVVKVSAGIMGKNWIHIQDGTGDSKKGSHNLVATSQDLPAVGDVVTVKGTAYKDKDFGGGYLYKVIVEEATVQK